MKETSKLKRGEGATFSSCLMLMGGTKREVTIDGIVDQWLELKNMQSVNNRLWYTSC